jgi:hypothetical protein
MILADGVWVQDPPRVVIPSLLAAACIHYKVVSWVMANIIPGDCPFLKINRFSRVMTAVMGRIMGGAIK